MCRLNGRHEFGKELRHLICCEDVVISQVAHQRLTLTIVGHLLTERITQRLRYGTFHLANRGYRIDDHAGVHDGHEPAHPHFTGLNVNRHLSELSRERRRRNGRIERSDSHNLALIRLVQRLQCDAFERNAAPIRGPGTTFGQADVCRRHVVPKQGRRHLANLLGHLLRGPRGSCPRDVRGRRGICSHVERREVGVRRVYDDILHVAPDRLCDHLRQDRV